MALVLVAAIAVTIFLTKDYWWPFVYDNLVYPPIYIPSGLDPENIVGQGGGSYIEIFFTAETATSEYPESWLVNKNLLKGYSRFYNTLKIPIGFEKNRTIARGFDNQTILKVYIFKYNNEKIAKTIFEKSGLESVGMGYRGVNMKHGPNKYVWQSNEFIVYIASAEGFESVAKDYMTYVIAWHTFE